MWGTLASWMPSILSGVSNIFGGRERNVAASAQAQRMMGFQERMSSTAHQREIADLRAAGLNPILSGTGGRGASSPGGAQAPMQDILSPAVASAMAARRLQSELKTMDAQRRNLAANTAKTEAQTKAVGPAGILGLGGQQLAPGLVEVIGNLLKRFVPGAPFASASDGRPRLTGPQGRQFVIPKEDGSSAKAVDRDGKGVSFDDIRRAWRWFTGGD